MKTKKVRKYPKLQVVFSYEETIKIAKHLDNASFKYDYPEVLMELLNEVLEFNKKVYEFNE